MNRVTLTTLKQTLHTSWARYILHRNVTTTIATEVVGFRACHAAVHERVSRRYRRAFQTCTYNLVRFVGCVPRDDFFGNPFRPFDRYADPCIHRLAPVTRTRQPIALNAGRSFINYSNLKLMDAVFFFSSRSFNKTLSNSYYAIRFRIRLTN
jgi:hypothetical protein